MSRHDQFASPPKRRPSYSILAMVGALVCAGLLGTSIPASADTFSHLPTIDLYPSVNFATGNDEYGSPGGPDPLNNYGPPFGNILSPSAGNAAGAPRPGKLDLNAVVTIPLIKNLNFQFEHDRCCGIDTTIGRTTGGFRNGNKYIYYATGNDIAQTYRLNYTGIKGVGVTLATFYRFTHDGGGGDGAAATNDPRNLTPSAWHQQSLTLSYTAPPIAALNGTTIGISGTGVMNKHHVSANRLQDNATLCATGGGCYSDTDGKYQHGINYGPNINIPINHGFSVFGSASYGAFDFFDQEPTPRYYNIIDFGIFKKLNQVLSLTADINNLTQINNSSFAFVAPEALHRVYLAIALDIHLAPK